nr:glycosyltransferase family 4 protein [candidate division Zixibacteria bacterium]
MRTSPKIVILGYADSVHLKRWANGLKQRGFDITVISLGGHEIKGIRTIIFRPRWSRNLSYFLYLGRVRQIIRQIRPDLIHAHYAAGFGFWGAASGKRPFLLSVWGSDITSFPSNFFTRRLTGYVLKSADYITATGVFLHDKTLEFCPDVKSKMAIIPFGVELKPIINHDRTDKKIKLIYIKSHEKIYGPDLLLKSLPAVLQTGMDINLTIAGSGHLTAKLKKLTADLNLANRVDFVGFVDNNELHRLLSEHDIMVMPSLSESFGVAALEAGAAGKPTVATAIGGIPEVVIDGETGILVPTNDIERLGRAIIKLASDADLRNKMGMAGRAFVEKNYDWERSLDLMTDLYEKMIAGRMDR